MGYKRVAAGLIVAVLVGGLAWYGATGGGFAAVMPWFAARLPAEARSWLGIKLPGDDLEPAVAADGTLEAESILVSSILPGRIRALAVSEGETVAAGDLLFELDTSLVVAEIAQAEAALELARAQLADARAGARAAELAVLERRVDEARAAAEAARVQWQDAVALVDAPDSLDVRIARAESEVAVLVEQTAAAESGAAAADLEQQLWARMVGSAEQGADVPVPGMPGRSVHVTAPGNVRDEAYLQWNLAGHRVWSAYASLNNARAALAGARVTLADLRAQKSDPLARRAAAGAAEGAYRVAGAAIPVAEAERDRLRAGAAPEEIAAAEAAVAGAQAAVEALHARAAQAAVYSPAAGMVASVVHFPGEVVGAGMPVLTIADDTRLTATVYVAEPQLGSVRLGEPVTITTLSASRQVFAASVARIADEAEFTPKNVQSAAERAQTVFAVKLEMAEKDGLKAGVPVRALFSGSETSTVASSPAGTAKSLRASGIIESNTVAVSSEIAGRIVSLDAREGDHVSAGQTLVRLDEGELPARQAQLEAQLAAARAALARVTAPPRPEEVAMAGARLRQAEAALAAAELAADDQRGLRARPQELDSQITGAAAQAQSAGVAIDLAQSQVKLAEVLQASLQSPGSDEQKTRRAVYDRQVDAARAVLRAAQAQSRGAQSVLAQLRALRNRPVALDASVHLAEGRVTRAQAALALAQAARDATLAAPRPGAVAAAGAQVAQAEAAIDLLRKQRSRLTISSPISGTVTSRSAAPGEVAQPGAALLSIADLASLRLVLYVPVESLEQIQLGTSVIVTTDAFPGRSFAGVVDRVGDRAEYTPKNVQTERDRARLVFAVKVGLREGFGELKPGMPADASFAVQ